MQFSQLWRKVSTRNRKRLVIYPSLLLGPYLALRFFTQMPGDTYAGPFAPLDAAEQQYAADLRKHVQMLAGTIGDRNLDKPAALGATRDYLDGEFAALGYRVDRQAFAVNDATCENLAVELTDKSPQIVLVGAHYDTARGAAGADDNGSGVAAVLALAKTYRRKPQPTRTLRFVLFADEEPPHFSTEHMGSVHYAQAASDHRFLPRG